MLRNAFVIGIVVLLGANALRGPFEALIFYLWGRLKEASA